MGIEFILFGSREKVKRKENKILLFICLNCMEHKKFFLTSSSIDMVSYWSDHGSKQKVKSLSYD